MVNFKSISLFTIALALAGFTATSCKKEEDNKPKQNDPVTVEISAPTAGQMVMPRDTLHIMANLKAVNGLHEYTWSVYSVMMDSVVHTETHHEHGEEYMLHADWVNNMMMHSDMMLKVEAEDHNGKTAADSVMFHAHH